MSDVKKVVLAYSGGLDTSVIVRWLIEEYGCEVVAYAADLGQGEELDPLNEKAIATGASKIFIKDLKAEFAQDYVWPALRAAAIYEGYYLLGTSLARPLIAKHQIDIAREEGADAVSHGATGKGNDQVRFELTYHALMPGITILAPWRDWEFDGRIALIDYCKAHNIPVTATAEKPYSMDRNLLHCSYEGGVLEDPWFEAEKDMFLLSVDPQDAPDQPEYVEVEYEAGDAVAINGVRMSPVDLLTEANAIAGRNGVGRVDIVENRFVGMKSRGVYETPGGTLLFHAHKAVEQLTLDREVLHWRDAQVPKYAALVYNGFWFSPDREVLQAAMDELQKPVSGVARLKLYKGSVQIVGRKSENSLYRPDIASFEDMKQNYDQKDAEGFIRLNALRLKLRN
ncbi:MAG: argininosuccinate synthase [Bradymonadia bacterium]